MSTLTDEFELTTADARTDTGGAALARTRRGASRGPSTWITAAVALIVAGVLGAPPASTAPAPGAAGAAWNILDVDLSTRPDPPWLTTVPVTGVVGVIAGTLVIEARDLGADAATRTVTGLDLGTGEWLWSLQDPEASCQLGARAVTCVHARGEPNAAITVTAPDGTVVATRRHPGALAAVDLDDGGLLLIEGGGAHDLADLVRLDTDSRQVWRTQLSISGHADTGFTGITLADGQVTTTGGSFDLTTGRASGGLSSIAETAVDGATRTLLDDGSTLVVSAEGVESAGAADEVWLAVDDRFGGDVTLSRDGRFLLVIARDTEELWRMPMTANCWPVARLLGTLLQRCYDAIGSSTLAFDQTTGERLWQRREAGGSLSSQVASPDTLLMTSEGEVAGIDPRTGEARWTILVPGTHLGVGAAGGALFVWSDQVLVRLA